MPISSYTTGQGNGVDDALEYNIEIIFDDPTDWTDAQQDAFIDAADFLTTLVTGDLDELNGGSVDLSVVDPRLGVETLDMDDLRIVVFLDTTDGPGGVLGSGGPLLPFQVGGRTDNLPWFGIMDFDPADSDPTDPQFIETVTHEMLHVMGFGTGWAGVSGTPDLEIIDSDGTYRFTGPQAIFEYQALYPTQYANDPNAHLGVPLQDGGAHWDEDVFGAELMTPFAGPGTDPLTNLTIAALDDLGYETTYTASCLVTGTMVTTDQGGRPVEQLTPGTRLMRLGGGWVDVLHVTTARVSKQQQMEHENLRAILIEPNALGPGVPERRLRVSKQHRFLATGKIVQRMFGEDQILIPAKDLLGLAGVSTDRPQGDLIYCNILCAKHEVIAAEGAWVETLFLGEEAENNLSPRDRDHIYALLASGRIDTEISQEPARPFKRGPKVQRMLHRMRVNGRGVSLPAHQSEMT